MSTAPIVQAQRLELDDSIIAVNDYFHEMGWTDGLPVIPPTEETVADMIAHTSHEPTTVLGTMPPVDGTVTVEKVAANAVMAGCKAEYFPVVIAGVKALLREVFNIGSVCSTTGGAAPVFIVNGPIAERLGINSGTGCLGPGFQANATIGRALRLVILNLGGARPGEMDKSTHAWPGKYGLCFAENEARSPWQPLHVDLGFPAESSTITVVGVRGVHYITEGAQETGRGNLETIAGAMRRLGLVNYLHQGNRTAITVILGPEHAQEIAADGFSREDVKYYLYDYARMPIRDLQHRAYWNFRLWPTWYDENDPDFMVPIVHSPEDFVIAVAGGDGRHSLWLPSWYTTQRVTEVIEGV